MENSDGPSKRRAFDNALLNQLWKQVPQASDSNSNSDANSGKSRASAVHIQPRDDVGNSSSSKFVAMPPLSELTDSSLRRLNDSKHGLENVLFAPGP